MAEKYLYRIKSQVAKLWVSGCRHFNEYFKAINIIAHAFSRVSSET